MLACASMVQYAALVSQGPRLPCMHSIVEGASMVPCISSKICWLRCQTVDLLAEVIISPMQVAVLCGRLKLIVAHLWACTVHAAGYTLGSIYQ